MIANNVIWGVFRKKWVLPPSYGKCHQENDDQPSEFGVPYFGQTHIPTVRTTQPLAHCRSTLFNGQNNRLRDKKCYWCIWPVWFVFLEGNQWHTHIWYIDITCLHDIPVYLLLYPHIISLLIWLYIPYRPYLTTSHLRIWFIQVFPCHVLKKRFRLVNRTGLPVGKPIIYCIYMYIYIYVYIYVYIYM
jgi:hypothetical protein